MPELRSWADSSDIGVRHYSGSVIYEREFDWTEPSRGRVWLDLGEVAVVATVTLNGRVVGTVWKPPYALEVTSALVPGLNKLEIRATNLWTNRLILDSGLPAEARKTWVTWNPYRPTDPLLRSGLLGPVRLRRAGD